MADILNFIRSVDDFNKKFETNRKEAMMIVENIQSQLNEFQTVLEKYDGHDKVEMKDLSKKLIDLINKNSDLFIGLKIDFVKEQKSQGRGKKKTTNVEKFDPEHHIENIKKLEKNDAKQYLTKLGKSDLIEICKKLGLNYSGNKSPLIERIAKNLFVSNEYEKINTQD